MKTDNEIAELTGMVEDIESRLKYLESQTNGLDGSLAWHSRSYPGARIDNLGARLEEVEAKIHPRHNLTVIALRKDLGQLRACLQGCRWQ